MSDFNASQVLAEAYTLYKKHHDGMGLDFKIAIAQVQAEAKAEALRSVMELHKPVELYPAVTPGVIYCVSCWDGVIDEAYEYPCPTAQAISDTLGGDDD